MTKPNMFALGSSYYPEQWEPSRWEDDFRKMQEIGFNTVRMGEFAWAFFEPAPGQFSFDWMDRAINLAARRGVKTILCTPTASPPPWLRQQQPDVLGGNEKGPFKYGARKGYCTNSAAFLSAADRIVTAMVKHYEGNPNIAGWQLDNEPGYPFVCYDDNCLHAFRRWLQERYRSLERLNLAWGTAFWSHVYSDWDQIEFPINVGDGGWNPGQRLDYRRFFSRSYLDYLRRQEQILRPAVGDGYIFTNWPNTTWSVDVFEAAGFLDLSAWDNYTATPGVTPAREQFGSGLNHDLCRCAGPNGRFLIAEQSTQPPAHALPEGIRLQTYIDLAHGAEGTIFFEWRPPLGGAEQGYISILQLDGSFGPAYQQYVQMGEELARIGPELARAQTVSEVALLYSYENQWEQGFWCGENGYDSEAHRWYQGLKTLGHNIDVLPPSADLSAYRLVVAPGLRIATEDLAERLARYVSSGGCLVLNHQAGTRQEDNRYHELLTPGVFLDLAGVKVPSRVAAGALAGQLMLGLSDQGTRGHGVMFDGDDHSFEPAAVLERIDLVTAQGVAQFRGGRMTGAPAITMNRFGLGRLYYVGCESRDPAFYDRLGRFLGEALAIEPLLDVPEGVEVVSRIKDDLEYLFVLNLTEEMKVIALPERMKELVTEKEYPNSLGLPGLDIRIFVRKQKK